MDNETQVSSSDATPTKNKYVPLILVVILFVILGGFYYYQSKKGKTTVMSAQTQTSPAPQSGKRKGMNSIMMKETTPAPLSDQQQQELNEGTSSATTTKAFTFSAGNFWFTPNKITVNKGDKVTINFNVANGFHDFVIDEFNVKVGPMPAGKKGSVTFTADKTGTFQFYCDIDHHRQKGQSGTLIVQ